MNAHFPKSKMTLIDLFDKFSDENYCREYLFEMRFKKGFVCPFCGCSECGKIATRHMLRCKYCRKQISPTNGTFMHGTHIKLKHFGFLSAVPRANNTDMPAVTAVHHVTRQCQRLEDIHLLLIDKELSCMCVSDDREILVVQC